MDGLVPGESPWRGAQSAGQLPRTSLMTDQRPGSSIDPTLPLRAKAGDRQAFAQLVDVMYPRSLRFALHMVGNREDAEEAVRRHEEAFGRAQIYRQALDVGGEYALRLRGEDHAWTANTVRDLQHAVRGNLPEKYKAFAEQINNCVGRPLTIRSLFDIRSAGEAA